MLSFGSEITYEDLEDGLKKDQQKVETLIKYTSIKSKPWIGQSS